MREKIKENNQRHKTINDSNTAIANNTHTQKIKCSVRREMKLNDNKTQIEKKMSIKCR